MKICFIGGGVSSFYASLLLKRKYKDLSITIFESRSSALSKLKASGNGRCNILNYSDDPNNYNNKNFVKFYLTNLPFKKQEELLNSFSIYLKDIKGYLYPISESSNTVYKILLDQIKKENIEIIYDHKLINFEKTNKFKLYFDNKKIYECDKLILSTGGKSYPSLGNIGNVFDILKNKNINITKLRPSLCSLKTKNDLSSLFGVRIKCNVILYDNKTLIHQEEGEITFKKDGLGGIVINNLSSFINWRNVKKPIIKLDFSKYEINEDKLNMKLTNPLYPFFEYKFADEIINQLKKNRIEINKKNILTMLNNIEYEIIGDYGFEYAQVTNGGISIDEINQNFEFKKIKDLFAIGEILDVDGLCGGFNLKWTLLCAHFLVELNKFN